MKGVETFLQATLAGKPGAAYVDVPSDVLFAEASANDIPKLDSIAPADHSKPSPFLRKPRASQQSINQAAKLLSQAQRYPSDTLPSTNPARFAYLQYCKSQSGCPNQMMYIQSTMQ